MSLARRVHSLKYDGTWGNKIAELAYVSWDESPQMKSAFSSLRELSAALMSRDAFIAAMKCWVVPTLLVLSLNMNWNNPEIQVGGTVPDIPLTQGTQWLLHRLHSFTPLLEALKLVITGPLCSRDSFDAFSPGSLSQLSHLRRLEVSVEMLPSQERTIPFTVPFP